MRKLIKNNVIPFTLLSVTILYLTTFSSDAKSLSALWYTDFWFVYLLVLGGNGLLFMVGDNQTNNKVAGLCLIGVLLFPLSSPLDLSASDWTFNDALHHTFAALFFVFKSLNHRKYDFLWITGGGLILVASGLSLYWCEFIGLYTLLITGYLAKINHFKRKRCY